MFRTFSGGTLPPRRFRHRPLFAALAAVLSVFALAGPGAPNAVSAAQPPATLRAMTRNLYWGADLAPVFQADQAHLLGAVGAAFENVRRTDFPERAEALADEIAGLDPHVVGLQEAALWRSGPHESAPATHVEYDFLATLLGKLADRGLHYRAAVVVSDGDYEAPGTVDGQVRDIRLTDRDALLVRTDLPANVFSVGGTRGERFRRNLVLNSQVLGSVPLLRGWVDADVTLHGRTFRVVSTHLENLDAAVRQAQAEELLAGPLADRARPSVLLGDLNTTPDSATYHRLTDPVARGGAAFTDVWNARHPGALGPTCCRTPDLRSGELTLRLDYVFFRGPFRALAADRSGEAAADRTPSGLWPSDHAGVRGVLQLR
ncbi:endonuclease/exonuclease/phosphatase family protein [Streptomyces sp. NPDC085866]|uniref:endonuclease/exonuclease/phosphatase family protein n=1 Tax=Streptomyces sp. NPDC085866 TaxID=3365736 RepID=UPI0037D39073